MKALFILLALSLPFACSARSWYIKPTVGAGRTGFNSGLGDKPEETMFFKGEFAAGVEFDHVRIETGLGYANPGYELKGLIFEQYPASGPTKYTDIEYNFGYVYLPVRAAYNVKIIGGLSVVPSFGITPLYNLHSKKTITATGDPSVTDNIKAVNKLGAFADAMLFAEYKIGTISVTAGASYKHMVSEVFEGGGSRFYLLSGDAGVLYHF